VTEIFKLVNSCPVFLDHHSNINNEFGNEVIVNFIIDIDGSVKNPRIVKKLCPQVNEEIIKVIKTLKRWTPAVLEDKRIPFLMTLSIDWKQEDIQICNK